jgi:hypothetical protein
MISPRPTCPPTCPCHGVFSSCSSCDRHPCRSWAYFPLNFPLSTSNVACPDVAGSAICGALVTAFPCQRYPLSSTPNAMTSSRPSRHPSTPPNLASKNVLAHLHLQHCSGKFAMTHSAQTHLGCVVSTNGLSRKACALGNHDEKLWCTLDVAWVALIKVITALAIWNGKQISGGASPDSTLDSALVVFTSS